MHKQLCNMLQELLPSRAAGAKPRRPPWGGAADAKGLGSLVLVAARQRATLAHVSAGFPGNCPAANRGSS